MRILRAAPALLASLLLLSCAGQVPPPGGPADTTPPTIVATFPDTNAVRVETNRIVLEFSEYVDRRSVEQSVFISPPPGPVEYEWSGTEVTILLAEPLREERTYVVSIGTDVTDRRERNRMAGGFTLAFSTGDSIDRGFISGRVYDDKPEGVMVFAYQLDGRDPDTLHPARTRPDYVTQTGAGGRFTLANTALGTYRVIAVRDEFRDLLYALGTDQFGVTIGDLHLSPERPRIDDVRFRLSTEDTTRPFIASVEAVDDRLLRVRYSEPIDTLSVAAAAVAVVDTQSGARLPVAEPYVLRSAPVLLIVPLESAADSGRIFRVRGYGIRDRAGNAADSSGTGDLFTGPALRDTTPPVITGPADTVRGFPGDRPLVITFSEPVDRAPASGGVQLRDGAGVPVHRERKWVSPVDLALLPLPPLTPGARYTISIVQDSLRDLSGNVGRDSVRTVVVETFDTRAGGSIEGEVRGEGALVLTARRVEGGSDAPRVVFMRKGGVFVMRDLPEGRYVLDLFQDSDSSGTFSPGRPFPFRPAEPFMVHPDTLRVRARWGVEGVVLQLK